jgi:hypothetical protein
MAKLPYPNSTNYQTFWGGRIKKKGTTFHVDTNSNSKWILNDKFRKQTRFEFGLNFLGHQPFWENLNNSPKLSLGMNFKNINLYGITCVKKF